MKLITRALLLVTLMSSCMLAAADQDTMAATEAVLNKPYVTVNGVAQPTAWAELIFRDQRQRGAPDNDEVRKAVREVLITQAAIETEARKAGLDKNVLLQGQMDLARREVLIRAWQQEFLAGFKADDKDIQAEYDRQVVKLGDKEYRIRNLLVHDESTAKLLIDKIKNGTKLESLAAEYSVDPATKDRGGLAEWTNISSFLGPIAEAVVKLKAGETSMQPVRSNFGWHVIQLAETRPFTPPALDQAKQQIIGILAQQALDKRIKTLREKAKVE